MTKKLFLFTFFLISCLIFSQVGINTVTPHPSSVLDLNSDTKGFLVPRLTTAAVGNLSTTASEGLIVFDREKKIFMGWDGTKWQNLGYEENNTPPIADNINLTGSYTVGSSLIANYSYSDADGDPDNASIFIWKKADDTAGTNTADIASANAQNYTLTSAELGKFIQFCVTPSSLSGASPGTQKCSVWSGPVTIATNQAPIASSVNITGTTTQDQTLTGNYIYNDNEGDSEGTSIFRWTRSDDAFGNNETTIAGATNSSYVLTATDVNKYIKFYVTPVASSGTTTGAETGSAFVGPISPLSMTPIALGTWNTTGLSTGSGNFGPSPWSGTAGSGVSSATIIRGSGASQTGTGASNAWGSDGLNSTSQANAETANDVWNFEFVPEAGKSLSITSIEGYSFRKSGSGPKNGQYQYRIGSGPWINIPGATISGISGGSAVTVAQSAIDLSGISDLQNVAADTTVYLRLVLWGATSTGGTAYMGYQNQEIVIKGTAQ